MRTSRWSVTDRQGSLSLIHSPPSPTRPCVERSPAIARRHPRSVPVGSVFFDPPSTGPFASKRGLRSPWLLIDAGPVSSSRRLVSPETVGASTRTGRSRPMSAPSSGETSWHAGTTGARASGPTPGSPRRPEQPASSSPRTPNAPRQKARSEPWSTIATASRTHASRRTLMTARRTARPARTSSWARSRSCHRA